MPSADLRGVGAWLQSAHQVIGRNTWSSTLYCMLYFTGAQCMEFCKDGSGLTGLLLTGDSGCSDILTALDPGNQTLRQSHEEADITLA